MILAITGRYKKEEKIFGETYYVDKFFKDIFDELDILLFPVISETNLKKVCELCDGLIVSGSSIDINPSYYGQEPIKEKDYSNYDEFILDSKLIKIFSENNKPILGICGGIQAINVTFGGTLHQNIDGHFLNGGKHKVYIEPNSFLFNTYKTNNIEVNSFHHQAIDKIANEFKVISKSEDGIIEAIEKGNIIGVQWHPEEMKDMKFFKSFIENFKVNEGYNLYNTKDLK